MQYVGQTKRRLMDRFQGHFYNVTKKSNDHIIGRHFNEADHHGIEDMEIHVLDFIHQPPETQAASYLRDRIENNWIHRLKTQAPWGLNMMD